MLNQFSYKEWNITLDNQYGALNPFEKYDCILLSKEDNAPLFYINSISHKHKKLYFFKRYSKKEKRKIMYHISLYRARQIYSIHCESDANAFDINNILTKKAAINYSKAIIDSFYK